jgi:hypothetical protein
VKFTQAGSTGLASLPKRFFERAIDKLSIAAERSRYGTIAR